MVADAEKYPNRYVGGEYVYQPKEHNTHDEQLYVNQWHNKPYYSGGYVSEVVSVPMFEDDYPELDSDSEDSNTEHQHYLWEEEKAMRMRQVRERLENDEVVLTPDPLPFEKNYSITLGQWGEEKNTDERRVTDPTTGGQKGEKDEEYAYIPSHPLAEVARVYGKGAKKYEPWNWSKGYEWRLSYSALFRHIEAHRRGESVDPDSGLSHLAHAAFHLFTLMEFERLELGTDDRWKA